MAVGILEASGMQIFAVRDGADEKSGRVIDPEAPVVVLLH
jgi:hypothetical protein